ncbi:MAG: hypothetical protein KGM43_16710 [Planctomycetota bacterium]|nr:hypothetical protein [Planctomycetota bacterium]
MKSISLPRKLLRVVFAAVLITPGLLGCESTRHGLRPRDQVDASSAESADDADKNVGSVAPKGFFKNSRLSGAMSSEGREIENDLGIK